ncbi:MAG: amidohydrolase family protein [Bacteroidota bacterium]|nr:amidohydrolase family protein [Bacteroidota bacterium]
MKAMYAWKLFLNRLTKLFLALIILVSSCTIKQKDDNYDYLIHGGTIIDGSGKKGFDSDILILDGKIVKIGKINPDEIDVIQTINATGMVVTPGFIDSHTHGDPIATPEFNNFIAMGVTTIVLGQDGVSPANISEWMTDVEEARPSLNVATLVGHGSIRDQSGVKINPNPDPSSLNEMAWLVEEAMDLGCFGLSTGLEYQPGSFSNLDELVAIAIPVAKRKGIIHSHVRSEDKDKISESIAELLQQGKGSGSAVQVSHMKIVYGKGREQAEHILQQMEKARKSGTRVTGDIYPYTASYTGIGIVFPSWAKPPNDYKQVVKQKREELAEYLRERIALRNGPAATLFGTQPWAGKTLEQVALEMNKAFEDVLIDDIGPGGASAAYFVMDQELQDRLMIDPYVMISSDGSPTMQHPRGYGSFAKVLRYYVREKQALKLEQAIHKMTGLPARTLGLTKQKRGLIKTGFAADILVFDADKVKDKADYENPHLLAEGFDFVMVNGKVVRKSGEFTGERGGQMLKKK